MQTIQKFQIGRKYYPSNSKQTVLLLIKERKGKELTVVKITSSAGETFTITVSHAADEKGAYEYFLFDGLRIPATNILPEARKVSAEEDKAVTEAIKRDIEYRKAHDLDRADVITERFSIQYLKAAHEASFKNKESILRSEICGCFSCRKTFASGEVTFRKEKDGQETAWCPYCDMDAVLGNASGYPITQDFLKAMQDEWL